MPNPTQVETDSTSSWRALGRWQPEPSRTPHAWTGRPGVDNSSVSNGFSSDLAWPDAGPPAVHRNVNDAHAIHRCVFTVAESKRTGTRGCVSIATPGMSMERGRRPPGGVAVEPSWALQRPRNEAMRS